MSTMTSCEEVLGRAAEDGSIEPSEWSRLFDTILARLEQNVHKEFPIPSIPDSPNESTSRDHPPTPPKTQTSTQQTDPSGSESNPSETINKENAPPSSPPSPASHSFAIPSRPSNSANASNQTSENSLPGPLLATWTYVRTTLMDQFSSYPPHTVQRLSELTLRPQRHYRFLPAYLNALDRVVSVSSGSNVFPLPAVDLGSGSGTLVNGAAPAMTASIRALSPSASSPPPNLDSDESFGGALLTPIPWLRRNSSTSAHSPPGQLANSDATGMEHAGDEDTSMETGDGVPAREGGAVTQGELMRQQQEAGDPPAAVAAAESRLHVVAGHSGAGAAAEGGQTGDGEDREQPHVRGPELIGMEDTGPQEPGFRQVLDMEAAVGRGPAVAQRGMATGDLGIEVDTHDTEAKDAVQGDVKKDSDGDVEITDVDALTEDDSAGDDTVPDAVETTA